MSLNKILVSCLGLGVAIIATSCTSYDNYKYAIEGQPIIATPTVFPNADQADIDYENYVVISDTKFYNSFWFGNNSFQMDQSNSNFKLVADYNVNYLRNNEEATIVINGYASELGSKSANMSLSLKRANYIKQYLISQGVNSSQITTKAYGNKVITYPLPNVDNNPSNRRVDIVYKNNPPDGYIFDNQKPIINEENKSLDTNGSSQQMEGLDVQPQNSGF